MLRGDLEEALNLYEKSLDALREPGDIDPQEAQERQKLLDTNSWNFGWDCCSLRNLLGAGSFMSMDCEPCRR